MPATGMSGIDVYQQGDDGQWRYVKTGRIRRGAGNAWPTGTVSVAWKPNTPCLVNLPLYNGIQSFALGVKPGSKIEALPPRASGVTNRVRASPSPASWGARSTCRSSTSASPAPARWRWR